MDVGLNDAATEQDGVHNSFSENLKLKSEINTTFFQTNQTKIN
jgi:hypothetical protein